jgi:hypothetical protein
VALNLIIGPGVAAGSLGSTPFTAPLTAFGTITSNLSVGSTDVPLPNLFLN